MKQPTVAPEETIPYQLGDLVAFLRVADHRSFSRAAAVLRESKGTVSRRISRLEAQLGARLFQRTSRAVALSEAGAHFRQAVEAALDTLEQATQRTRQAQDEPEGTLRLTAPDDLASHLAVGLLGSFLAAHPKVRVELVASDAVLDLAANRLDVALRASMALADSSDVAVRLCPLELGCFAAPAYLSRAGTPRRGPAALAGAHRLVMRTGDARADWLVLREPGGAAGQRLAGRPVFEASSYSNVLAAAEEGLGIAFLPTMITQRAVRAGRLRRVLPRFAVTPASLYLVHARGLLPARVRAFRDHVRAHFAAQLVNDPIERE